MASANEILAEPYLDIPEITASTSATKGYTHHELAIFRIGHDDIDQVALTIYNFGRKKGQKRHVDVRRDILDATFEDSIDQTPTFTITLRDPDWEFLNTGALDHNIDINPAKLPKRHYRLDNVGVNDDELTLTFATRNAVYVSKHKRPFKASRRKMTRAQFIKHLLRSVKKTRIPMYCPQLNKKQRQARFEHTPGERRRNRAKGFSDSDKITSKHQAANQIQRDTQESIIRAGVDVNAPKAVIILAVMTAIQESDSGARTTGNPPFVGPFQQASKYGWPGTGNAYKDAKGFYAKAIPYWKKNKGKMTLGMMAQQIQGASPSLNPLNSGFAQETDGWRDEAEHSVNAYSGLEVAGAGDPDQIEFRKKYEFMVGEPDGPLHENYLAAITRLAEEVNWRAYWVRDTLHYMSEEDLFKSKAQARLRRYHDGVERISFNWDHGKRLNEMTLSVRMVKWACPVGTVVVFDEGGPARGRWLVTNIRRSMFDELGEITLKKPMREKVEPIKTGIREPSSNPDSSSPSDEDLSGLGGIEAVKSTMTPGYIIDHFVVPRARNHHMATGIDLNAIKIANGPPQHVVNSDHYGPRYIKWAVDMSNGTNPTPQMDDLASELIMAFNLPDLADPLATRSDGLVIGNLVQKDHKGFQFTLIYRTNLGAGKGGDHYNHVHFGCKKLSSGPAHLQ